MIDFKKEVLAASNDQPVVVDFWAPWCGPCQVIGPALEALEKEQGRWKLVKVNVDENPQISQEFGIRGIPDVRLFSKGQEVNRFTGALPKHQISQWLDEHIPDERLGKLEDLTSAAAASHDYEQLRVFVHRNSDFKPGFVALAKLILWQDPEESRELLSSIKPSDKEYTVAQAIGDMAELLSFVAEEDLPVAQKLASAREALAVNKPEQGIEHIIEAVMMNKNYAHELPRRSAIAFFQLMGPDHEWTKAYRRKFDMALY